VAETLDEMFKSEPQAQDTAETVVTQEAETAQEPAAEGAPAAPDTQEKHVPLSALEAERKGRQDWKEKAIRAEEEAKQLRERMQQFQNPQQQQAAPQIDPLVNTRMDFSEMLLRQELKEATDIDEKIMAFKQAAQADPSLVAAMMSNPHPWKFAYEKARQMEMLKEIGTDPAAYRAKLEAEIRAQLQSAQPQAPAPLNVPASLNGARSVAPRNAPTFSGPTPLGSIFNR
jgi:hypothetical protein